MKQRKVSECEPVAPTGLPVLKLDDAGRRAAARIIAKYGRQEGAYMGNDWVQLMYEGFHRIPNVEIDRTRQ